MEESSERGEQPVFSPQEVNTVELPLCIDIKESMVHKGEAGAFAKTFIRKDTRFGPYKGEIINPDQKDYIDYRYAWEVHEKRSRVLKFTISALDPKASNWMRHVNNARFYEEQNILSVQDGFSIFYVAMKDIHEGQELLTWFDPKLLRRTQRRQTRQERRPIGYTIELVPWSDEKKFTPEIIETKRARKKKVLSDMISLDEDPMAMTRTLQSLPKIPCTPRQLGNMAYPLANSLKRRKKDQPRKPSRPPSGKRDSGDRTKVVQKAPQNKSIFLPSTDQSQKSQPHIHTKAMETKVKTKLESLPPHENLKEALQAAQDGPKMVPYFPPPEAKTSPAVAPVKNPPGNSDGQVKVKKKRGRKRLSDIPRGRPRQNDGNSMSIDYLPGYIRPVCVKNKDDGSTVVEDHDESYTLTGVTLNPQCDDLCPCLDKRKCMLKYLPSPANNYAMRFTLLPEHRVVKNNKILYRCDVCDGTYNHAFSLKRHYLSVHINHRYLTREDIVCCQIETFHTGIQIEESQAQFSSGMAPHSTAPVPMPTFMALNVTNLMKPLSPSKKISDNVEKNHLEEVGSRLRCDEELGDEKGSHQESVSDLTGKTKSVPTLSALAQACINRSKALHSTNMARKSSKLQTQISLECKETLESDLLSPTDAELAGGKGQIVEDKESIPCEDLTGKVTTQGSNLIDDVSKQNGRSETLCLSSMKGGLVNGDTSKKSLENSNCEPSGDSARIENNMSDISNEMALCDADQPMDSVVCDNISHSKSKSKSDDLESSYGKQESIGQDPQVTSADNNNTSPKTESKSLSVLKRQSQSKSDENVDCTDETDSFSVDTDSKEVSVDPDATARVPDPSNMKLSKNGGTIDSSHTPETTADVSKSPKDCENAQPSTILLDSGAGEEDTSPSNNVLSITTTSSCSLPIVKPLGSPPSLKPLGSVPGVSPVTQVQTSRGAQPPVIFLTNIVFPMGSSASLGQPQQKPLATVMSQAGTTLLSPSSTTPLSPTTSTVQTVSPTARFPGPRAGGPVPLVLISQVPPGVDPRNAANTFLNTSTGIKTLQDLQKSFSVAAMGNSGTQLTASNLPCFIAPLGQGTGAVAGKTTTPVSCAADVPSSTSLSGLAASSSKSSSTASTQSSQTSSSSGAALVSSPKTSTALASSVSALNICSSPLQIIRTSVTAVASSVTTLPGIVTTPKVTSTTPAEQPQDLFRCHMCVLVFQTMQQLKHHIRHDPHRFKGGIKQYACVQCSMRFSNKNNLARHNLMTHSEAEDYKFRCFTCGKGFSSETYLRMHARFHSGKNFPCKYGCKDVCFPNAASLVKHLRTEHAGLDLKEYRRIHKIRPVRRKKINQILGGAPSTSVSSMPGNQMHISTLPHPGPSDTPSNIVPGAFASASNGHPVGLSGQVVPTGPQPASAYSLSQPGIGFQAKRGRPKGSKNTVKNGKPIIPSPMSLPTLLPPPPPPPPLKVDIPVFPAVQEPHRIKRPRGIARFCCKLCPRKFTTHLKLLRHRTRKHKMDQSVQEYLQLMSRNTEGYNSEPDNNVYSPPASPKTFFSNVNQRGYENFTQFIDGGYESLKSPIKKYINIKGFTSMSAPFDASNEQKVELEWTSFNFPPSFKYNYDSTTFYETEGSQNFKPLADKTLAHVKTEPQNESTPETEYYQRDKEKSCEEDPLALPPKYEDHKDLKNQEPENDSNVLPAQTEQGKENKELSLENATSLDAVTLVKVEPEISESNEGREDPSCTIGSKERGKQVIESLARHLACEKLPEGESDISESPSQVDEGVECEGEQVEDDIHIKTERLDEDPVAEEGRGSVVEKECGIGHQAAANGNSENPNLNLGPCTSRQIEKACLQNAEGQNPLQDDVPVSGIDSGLNSLSSCTPESLDIIQSSVNGNICSQSRVQTTTSTNADTSEDSKKPSMQPEDVTSQREKMKLLNPVRSLKPENELPVITALDKKEMMKSLTIQGIIVDHNLKSADRKLPRPSAVSRSLNALDLSSCGGQLSSDRLARLMKSGIDKQELDTRLRGKPTRHRSISLPSLTEGDINSNTCTSDAGKHHEHRRLSLWGGHLRQKALEVGGQEPYHFCPIVNIIQKQQALREIDSYEKAKADRDKGVDKNHFPGNKLAFAESMGLMSQVDYDICPLAKQQEVHVIKPPEVWANYENIWFGKRGTIVVVCSICHRHFSCWDLCLRHQLKKHPHIEPNFLQMEKGNYVDDMYYYYPMKFGILAQTEPIPSNLPLPELYVCTRCGFPFRNLNRLHAHIVSCDPSLEGGAANRLSYNRKKLIPMMDRRLSQQNTVVAPVKPKLGRPFKRPPQISNSNLSGVSSGERLPTPQLAQPDSPRGSDKTPPGSVYQKPASLGSPFSFYHGRKRKNYELLYNPQNHMRRREMYQVLDTHQCHGCNLKFKSMSMLERHVKKCSGRDRLQSQKPLLSGIMPDDAAVRKQHTCRYCNKRFTYIKGVDLHYKRICSVRKIREEEGKLTHEDLAHEEELRKIIEHMKWSKTLNKDSSDIIQGHVRVEEDGSLTRVVKRRGCPAGVKKRVKKRKVKNKRWTYMKNHRHANRSAASSAASSLQVSPRALAVHSSTSSTGNSEIESSSLQGHVGFQKKRSATNSGTPSPEKKRLLLSDHSPPDAGVSPDRTRDSPGSATGKRGRPRKYPIGDSRSLGRASRRTRSNSSANNPTTDSKTSASPGEKEAESVETTDRPQPRKRGRPKKFDPSEMESSYKKKKKIDPSDADSSVASLKDLENSKRDAETALKEASEQSASSAVTRRQQRAKMPTAAVRDDFLYEDLGAKRKPAPSRARNKAGGKEKTQSKEGPPFSELELMEKMKELKKAAQIESDKYKQRQEQRKMRAKILQKQEGRDQLPVGKLDQKPEKAPKALSSNSTELFKHLMEDIPLSSKTKAVSSHTGHSSQVSTLPVNSVPSILKEKPPSKKSPSLGTSKSSSSACLSAANKPSLSVSVLASNKSSNPKLPSPSVHIKAPEIPKAMKDNKAKSSDSAGFITSTERLKTVDLKTSAILGPDEDKSASASNIKPTSPSKGDKKKPTSPNDVEKSLNSPVSKLPECSVKVVALSPNQTSLITCKSSLVPPCEDKKDKSTLSSSSSEDFAEKTSDSDKKTSDTNSIVALDSSKNDATLLNKTNSDEIGQSSTFSDISTELSLYSNEEELLSMADTSTSSHSSSKDCDPSISQRANVSILKESPAASGLKKALISDLGSNKPAEIKVLTSPQDGAPRLNKRTKIVLVHAGKSPQIVKCVTPEDPPTGRATTLSDPATELVQPAAPGTHKLPASVSTLSIAKSVASLVAGGDGLSSQTNSAVSFAVLDSSVAETKKSLSAPIRLIRGGLAPHKTPSVAPITVFSQQKSVSPLMTPSTQSSMTASAVPNILMPQKKVGTGTPADLISIVCSKSDSAKGLMLKQGEPVVSNLTTHFQIKGGVVTHRPRVVQTSVSPRPVPIVSSLKPVPSHVPSSKPISPKHITTIGSQSSLLPPVPTIFVRPASSQSAVKTSAKVISPPARIVSQSIAVTPPLWPKGAAPGKVAIPPEAQTSFLGALKLPQTCASTTIHAAASPSRGTVVMPTFAKTQPQTHVIRTLMPSKSPASNSAQHPKSVIVSSFASSDPFNVPASNAATSRHPSQVVAPAGSNPSVYQYSSSQQHLGSFPQPLSATSLTANNISTEEQISFQPEGVSNVTATRPRLDAGMASGDADSLFMKPPSNPIMITLEDGSTAMLDPESLAQLLSPIDQSIAAEPMLEPSTSELESDPGHVMVNMSEIQPGQGMLQAGEVLWEGFPDISDATDSF